MASGEVNFPLWVEDQPLDDYLAECRKSAAVWAEADVLEDCIKLLTAFACENFLGPPTPAEAPVPGVSPVGMMTTTAGHKLCVDHLLQDGEVMPISIRRPLLLIVALHILEGLETSLVVQLWRLRTLFLYQRCLSRKAHTLRKKLDLAINDLKALDSQLKPWPLPIVPAQLYLEIGHVHSFYREVARANTMFLRAQNATGLKTELTGVLGVRTEHQEFKVAQLVVQTTAVLPAEPFQEPHPGARVRMIQSEDCNVLQRPCNRNLVFKEVDPSEEAAEHNLAHLDTAVLIAQCLNVRNNNPHHGLTGREMLAYIERCIGCTNLPYALEVMCLSLKAKLEWERNRVAERALLQLQEMVDAFVMEDGDSQARFPLFWSAPLHSYVAMLKDLGRRYTKIGMFKTAEAVGEVLQDWEFVVQCCLQQGNEKRAEKIAKELIEKEPDNPLHWCALAEATRSKEHYLTAWEKSNQKLAAPMRGIARLCVELQQWDECVQYFEKALAMNPMYGGNWFTYGVACQRTERYEQAAYAFTRVVMLNPDEGEAWNNLGTVLLRLGRQRQAFHAITMAARLMEYSWRVRDNHYRIAIDLEEWQQGMNDLMRLLDSCGHRYKIDPMDLSRLLTGLGNMLLEDGYRAASPDDAITTVVEEGEGGEPALVVTPVAGTVPMAKGAFRERTEKLISKLYGTYTDNAGVYQAVADFYAMLKEGIRAHEFYLKLERAAKMSTWREEEEKFRLVVDASVKHAEWAQTVGELQALSQSSRMIINTIKGAADTFADHPLMATLQDLKATLNKAQQQALVG